MLAELTWASALFLALVVVGIVALIIKCYRKALQGEALVRTGLGDAKVSFSGMLVIPIIHKMEVMDISLKTVVITRTGSEGLICMDNMRADIKVTFFVKVNKTVEDVLQVAQAIGCQRASDQGMLENLFDAKFSEALKTVGKRFDFVELYNSRDKFKAGILQIIGTDLNGYILDDCAIDYLEQTPITALNPNNILDAEGIKKIIDLTAKQKVLSNQIERDKEKTIKQQDVEAREAILEMERHLAENEEKQRREINTIKAREESTTMQVQQEERLKSERARIQTDEELLVAIENKNRQVIVAEKNKERTKAVETERVERDRQLEATERERIVTLAEIEKTRAVEEQQKNIQEVIRERVVVQKAVVEEEERIKDTQAFAEANRVKTVAIKNAEKEAEEALVLEIKAADAARQAAEFKAKQSLIDAEAEQLSAIKRAEATKVLAEAEVAKEAATGLAEAKVIEAKAYATEKQGIAEANVIRTKYEAEAKGIELTTNAQAGALEATGLVEAKVTREKAEADKEKGLAEAEVLQEKMSAEAKGILQKADAMKKLDGVGRDHEEFKLKLDKEKSVELAAIQIQQQIAESQAQVLSEALKNAKIDIVGGDGQFFDKLTSAITQGKSVDRMIGNSKVLGDLKHTLIGNGEVNGEEFRSRLKSFVGQFGLTSEDVKNLSIAGLILKMSTMTDSVKTKETLNHLLHTAQAQGIADKLTETLQMV